jgi:uncharacterized radical SAM superfamily protein
VKPIRLCIDLFCRGFKIDPSCELEEDARGVRRTRAGLGSGLEVIVPSPRKDHWINVPVTEPFVAATPWTLRKTAKGAAGKYVVVDSRTKEEYPVRLPPEPAWYAKKTSSGRPMTDIGVLQGTYLGIYVGGVCAFWAGQGSQACGFCTTGRNVGDAEVLDKTVEDVVETALAAKAESGVTFVHLNTGYSGESTLDVMVPYIRALKERVGCLVGVQATPAQDLTRYDRLKAIGVDHLSFCYEFQDPEQLKKWCPGKDRALGQQAYFRALEYTSKLFGRAACSGEIIAGVEPLEWTLKAIDWIASVGAFPTVCIFRPTVGSRMENLPSPDPEEMVVVFREVWNACRRHMVPVGLAPNIEVSLIIQPDDAADLVEDGGLADAAWRATLAVAKVATKPVFAKKMRKRAPVTK